MYASRSSLFAFAIAAVLSLAVNSRCQAQPAAGSNAAMPSNAAPMGAAPGTRAYQSNGDVEQLLAQADAFKDYGITSTTDMGRHLVGPPDASAVSLYRKVLVLQPGNQRARRGLQEIAAFYTRFAQSMCDKSLFEPCKMEAKNGLLADPFNATLDKLEQQADAGMQRGVAPRTGADQSNGDVEQLLAQADAYENYGTTSKVDVGRNLVSPPEASAVGLYRKVLALQPGNPRAGHGLQEIAAFYTGFAQSMCNKSLFEPCKLQAEDGLLADPDSATLKNLVQQADAGMQGNASGR